MHDIKIYDVRCVEGDSAFLVDDGKTAVLYDTGFAFTGNAVADNIEKILCERKLDYIFLTHSHYDHAAGTPYIKKRYPEACVVAGSYAAKIFEKDSAKSVMRELDLKAAEKCGVFEYEDLFDSLSVDVCVEDGDTVSAGEMNFKVVSLPGHTKCSVGFYLTENKLLLSSETLGVYAGQGIVVPSYLVGYSVTVDSIKKAAALDVKNVVAPHLGLLDEADTRLYFGNMERHATDTAYAIADILKNGGSDEDAFIYFKDKYYKGEVIKAYPIDAMKLNTSIMIKLIRKELCEGGFHYAE